MKKVITAIAAAIVLSGCIATSMDGDYDISTALVQAEAALVAAQGLATQAAELYIAIQYLEEVGAATPRAVERAGGAWKEAENCVDECELRVEYLKGRAR